MITSVEVNSLIFQRSTLSGSQIDTEVVNPTFFDPFIVGAATGENLVVPGFTPVSSVDMVLVGPEDGVRYVVSLGELLGKDAAPQITRSW